MVFEYSTKKIATTQDDSTYEQQKIEHQKRVCRKTLIWSEIVLFLLIVTAFTIIWVIIPVSFKFSINFQKFIVFIPINSPRGANFDRPEEFGLRGVHNYYFSTRDYYQNETWTNIGAWIILPEDEINSTSSTNTITEILQNTNQDILIYLHGVFSNRAKALEQYRVLRKHFLIVAVDHRGYGDSGTNVEMSEASIANDHLQIYEQVKSMNHKNDIYYWGHSLGSALSTRTLKLLKQQKNIVPKGLILESSFTTLTDVIVNIVIGRIFSWLPYFEATVLKPLDRNGFHFRSRDNILSIDCPIMLLHAEDDSIVPYFLGETLAMTAMEHRRSSQGSVVFHGISAKYGFGHNEIILHPHMDSFIDDFKMVSKNFSSKSSFS